MANSNTAELQQRYGSTGLNRLFSTAINKDMYVVLNTTWDGGWLENIVRPPSTRG